VPEWVTNPNQQAAFRKLPADERDRLEALPADQRRGAVRQAAIAAGIVKVPSVLDKLRTLWAKASEADRRTFMDEVSHGR
jgi:predicted aminopeptidase